jgi:hypothetical protein
MSIRSSLAPPLMTATWRAQLSADGMAKPHRERIRIRVEKLAMKPLESIADPDHEIDGAGEFRLKVRRSPPRRHLDPQMWRDPHDLFHERRHQ